MPASSSFSARSLLLIAGVVLMWGAVALTHFLYFLFIVSAPIFLVGFVLVMVSGQRPLFKAVAVVFPFLAVGYTGLRTKTEGLALALREQPTTFLIPEGFEGTILLVRNEPCAPPPRRENGRVVYRVPANGLLITRDTVPNRDHPYYSYPNKGYCQRPDNKYYVVDRQGRRLRELTEMHGARMLGDDPKEPGTLFSDGRDELAAFYRTPQNSQINSPSADFAFQYITIGTLNRLDSLQSSRVRRHLHALADSLLARCRVSTGLPPLGLRKLKPNHFEAPADSTVR